MLEPERREEYPDLKPDETIVDGDFLCEEAGADGGGRCRVERVLDIAVDVRGARKAALGRKYRTTRDVFPTPRDKVRHA